MSDTPPSSALLQALIDQGTAAREMNELMREHIESYERDNRTLRTTLEAQQATLETQQAAIAVAPSP